MLLQMKERRVPIVINKLLSKKRRRSGDVTIRTRTYVEFAAEDERHGSFNDWNQMKWMRVQDFNPENVKRYLKSVVYSVQAKKRSMD